MSMTFSELSWHVCDVYAIVVGKLRKFKHINCIIFEFLSCCEEFDDSNMLDYINSETEDIRYKQYLLK